MSTFKCQICAEYLDAQSNYILIADMKCCGPREGQPSDCERLAHRNQQWKIMSKDLRGIWDEG